MEQTNHFKEKMEVFSVENGKLGSTDKAEGGLYGKGRHGYSIKRQGSCMIQVQVKVKNAQVPVATDADLEVFVHSKLLTKDGDKRSTCSC